jgi:hypothetical protein
LARKQWSSGVKVDVDVYDGIAIGGLVLLGIGLWWHDPVVALIVLGALLLSIGVALGARKGKG